MIDKYEFIGAGGGASGCNHGGYGGTGMQNAYAMTNAYVPPEVMRLRRAQKIAAEVRARRPEMQVRKVVV